MPELIKSHRDPRLTKAHAAALKLYGKHSDVWGVDVGYRHLGTRMKPDGGLVVRVHVSPKASFAATIPAIIEGVEVVVLDAEYGRHGGTTASNIHDRMTVVNPLRPGVQVAQKNGAGGTLGLIVFDLTLNKFSILSNEHVLRVGGGAGDDVVQPAFLAGGSKVATFTRAIAHPTGDAALAGLDGGRRLSARQFGTRVVVLGPDDVMIGDVVRKSGAASGITEGVVDGIGRYRMAPNESVGMDGFRIVARPRNTDISKNGDSGAVWFRKSDKKGLGLHVGGDLTVANLEQRPAIAAHLPAVLQALNAQIRPIP